MESLKTAESSLPPCCMVEIGGVIVIGTYKLDDTCRQGTLDVYSPDLDLLGSTPTKSAVLDISVHDGQIYAAHSTGFVSVWKLDGVVLVHVSDLGLGDEDQLVLQLDFNDTKMAATLTDGSAIVYDLQSQEADWRAKVHELEPWCVRFGNGGLWTGGDDQALCFSDQREGTRLIKTKYHDAGVTSILPISDNMLWTGGYDDRLRLFDLRTRRSPDDMNLGGGVWRLLPNPQDQTEVLTCCMYNGLAIFRRQGELELPVVQEVQTDIHKSMVYGGAWLNGTAYTCSFYDLLVQKLRPRR